MDGGIRKSLLNCQGQKAANEGEGCQVRRRQIKGASDQTRVCRCPVQLIFSHDRATQALRLTAILSNGITRCCENIFRTYLRYLLTGPSYVRIM